MSLYTPAVFWMYASGLPFSGMMCDCREEFPNVPFGAVTSGPESVALRVPKLSDTSKFVAKEWDLGKQGVVQMNSLAVFPCACPMER